MGCHHVAERSLSGFFSIASCLGNSRLHKCLMNKHSRDNRISFYRSGRTLGAGCGLGLRSWVASQACWLCTEQNSREAKSMLRDSLSTPSCRESLMNRGRGSNSGKQIDIGFPPSQESGFLNPKKRLYSSEALKTGETFTPKCRSLRAQV